MAKTGNIPSLAFCCEITSFPNGRFVSSKVLTDSLCPIYWEATPESCPVPLEGTLHWYIFLDGTVTVDVTDYSY